MDVFIGPAESSWVKKFYQPEHEEFWRTARQALADGDFSTAFDIFFGLAEQNNPEAYYQLGMMYYKGQGMPQNIEEAEKYFRHAANDGHSDAIGVLNLFFSSYGRSNTRTADIPHNAPENLPVSTRSTHEESLQLADELFSNREYDVAREAYEFLAEMDVPEAHHQLGVMYQEGLGVIQDQQEADKYFRQAEKLNRLRSSESTRGWDSRDDFRARESEIYGSPRNQPTRFQPSKLGLDSKHGSQARESEVYGPSSLVRKQSISARSSYSSGTTYVPYEAQQDLPIVGQSAHEESLQQVAVLLSANRSDLALPILESFAKMDVPEAHHQLGVMYQEGLGVIQDQQEADKYFRQARYLERVQSNNPMETVNSGDVIWARDSDVSSSAKKLNQPPPNKRILVVVDSEDDSSSETDLLAEATELFQKGEFRQAREIYEIFSKQNNSNANYQLGLIYASGLGIPQNMQTALKYLQTAGDLGCIEAYRTAGNIHFNLGDYDRSYTCYNMALEQHQFQEIQTSWLSLAAEHMQAKNYQAAYALYLPLAKNGNKVAQQQLGLMCLRGTGGLKNDAAAVQYLTAVYKAEKKKYNEAFNAAKSEYGHKFDVQLGEDYKQALKKYTNAKLEYARQQTKHDLALVASQADLLGDAYQLHLDKKDKSKALGWYAIATNAGHQEAPLKMAKIHMDVGIFEAERTEDVIKHLTRALDNGNKKAANEFIRWYEARNPWASKLKDEVVMHFYLAAGKPVPNGIRVERENIHNQKQS